MNTRYAAYFLAFSLSVAVQAQIPNPGFENWTVVGLDYEYPAGWYNLNPVTYSANVFTCQRGTAGPEGSFFVRVTSRNFNGSILPGTISATTSPLSPTGFPYAQRPGALTGKWQYQVSAPDQAMITVALTKWNAATQETEAIGAGTSVVSGSLTSWADFSVPITYVSAYTPDTAQIIVYSSVGVPTVGSTISIDALAFGSSTGVAEGELPRFEVYPSPATDAVWIRSDASVRSAQVLDAQGRECKQTMIFNDRTVNVAALPSGSYYVRVVFADGANAMRAFVKL